MPGYPQCLIHSVGQVFYSNGIKKLNDFAIMLGTLSAIMSCPWLFTPAIYSVMATLKLAANDIDADVLKETILKD